jgi:hypothetical protein
MTRPLLLLLALVGLAACGSPLNSATNNGIVSLGIDYTVKKVEKRYDVECSVFNILEAGEYCVHKYKATDREEVHCFKTLGGVDCYTERDPYMLAGRSLPTAPRQLADPRMPMEPPPNRLLKVVEKFDHDAFEERREAEAKAASAKAQAEREDKQKVEPAQPSPATLPAQ